MTVELPDGAKPTSTQGSKRNKVKQSSGSSTKVVRSQFSDNVTILTDAAKNLIRTKVAFGDWVLDSNPDKPNWVWGIIKNVPTAIGISLNQAAQDGLQEALRDVTLRNKLITYVRSLNLFMLSLIVFN